MKPKSHHLILLALKDGPKHGYQIIKYLEEKSTGYFSVGYGALYPALHSLEKGKFIQGEWEPAGEAKEKKIYKLTAKGQKEITAIGNDLRAFAKAIDKLMEVT
jgi:DNA-binding PadR family transcriptional regulator